MAAFPSEWVAGFARNGGRFPSEYPAGFPRNTHLILNQRVDNLVGGKSSIYPWYKDTHHFVSAERVNKVILEAFQSKDLAKLGEALHMLQDYYAHLCPKEHAGDKPSPDDIRTDPEKAVAMAKETMFILRLWHSIYCRDRNDVTFMIPGIDDI